MSDRIRPVTFVWREVDVVDEDGVATKDFAMVPRRQYVKLARQQWHAGEDYTLVPLEARSRASHNQYFAALHDGFYNLPHGVSEKFATPEHLRAWLLIETHWCRVEEHDLRTKKGIGGFVRACQASHYVRVVYPEGSKVVKVYIPKSQSAQAMGKAEFEASKRDVLDLLESMVGVKRGQLMKEAARHA